MIYNHIGETIGNTPLIKLKRLSDELNNNILVKTESRNPTGSVKCRVAYSMIKDAELAGTLKAGMHIIEPTSGNTGIALCAIGKAKGYDVTIVMPETMSEERKQLMTLLGAELICTPGALGMKGAIAKADEIMKSKGGYYMPNQFINSANPAIHVLTTGPEIDKATQGAVDVVVSGVGTGGTISGVGKYFRDVKNSPITMVAVEPDLSPVISQTLNKEEIKPGAHKIQGIGAGFIPMTLDLSLIDHVETVDIDAANRYASNLMRSYGILSGISGGAALAATVNVVKKNGWKNKTVVVIIPDSGERYLSTFVNTL